MMASRSCDGSGPLIRGVVVTTYGDRRMWRRVMPTYAMLARPSPEALVRPGSAVELNRQVEDRIKSGCPGVRWLANCAVMGPCDYLDVFEAPDVDTATKVSLLVRPFGHATAETWVVTPWECFMDLATDLKS
jgi:uncharacterized protein with GYD domain